MLQHPHVLLTFDKVHNPLRLPRETTSERPKVVRTPGVFNILTSKLKWSEHGVFCTFWLRHVLRATTACTFLTSQLPKVVRSLHILTSKCASRHNGVQLFLSHLASWLRTRRFGEPTFRPSGATNHWKNSASRLSYLFARLHLLSSDSFSSLIFSLLLFPSLFFWSTSAFHLPILSGVWLLNFLRWYMICTCTYIHIHNIYIYIHTHFYTYIHTHIYIYRLAFLYIYNII